MCCICCRHVISPRKGHAARVDKHLHYSPRVFIVKINTIHIGQPEYCIPVRSNSIKLSVIGGYKFGSKI